MEEIIRTLVEMDPSMISQYVDYFFLAIAAVGLIGFIIGFIKGFYKESTTFILTAVYFVLLAFVNKWISSAIYELDITSFVPQLPEGVKTVGDYLNNILLDLCEKNGITISNSQELVNAIVSIALAFVNLVVYLVLLLAGIIIVGVVDFIVYFLIVRLIVPKSARKYRKKRLFGGGLALIRYVVAFSLLLSPFTAIVNSTVGNLRDENGKVQRNELDNDFYNALMNVLEGYNNSTVAKVFFIVEDEDGRSIDVRLMDYITKSKIDEETAFSLYNEIGNFGSLAIDAVSTGFIQSTSAIDLALLLQAEFVGHAIDTLAKSTLVQTVLSVGVTLAVNMDKVKEFVDLSSIDFMQVDWSSTLNAVSTAYEELYETGLVDEVIENPETFLNDFYLDGEHANGIKSALRELGDNELICKIMPPLIASFISSMNNQSSEESNGAKRSDNFEIPDALQDPDTYKDIMWGKELASLYEVLENLSKQYYGYENEHLTFNMINTLQPDVILNALFGTGIDFSKEDDTSYKQEYERNVFVYGGEYINEEVTHKLPGIKNILGVDTSSTAGLLNLQIIDVMFEKDLFNDFISLLDLNQLLSLDANKIDLNEEVVDVVSDWKKLDWQNELSAIVDVVCPIMKLVDILGGENATVSEAKRAASEPEIDLDTILGDDSLNCLKRVTDVLVDSQIFNEILPDVLEVYTDDMQDELIEGLALSDLNFTYFASNDDSMVKELRSFIDEVDVINEDLSSLLDDITGENAIDALVSDCAKDQSVLGKLLKIIKDNQILNKPLTPEEKLNNVNTTFTNVMIGLLSNGANPENTMNIYNMTDGKVVIEKETIINFDNSDTGWEDEIDGLVGFIGSLKGVDGEDQVILDYLSGNTDDGFDLGTEIFSCGDEIERIFASVDDSVILKEAFPNTFEMLIGDSFGDIIGGKPNFRNIESWEEEGHYFNQLLSNVDSLREDGQSLKDIKWLEVEEEKLINILTSLYNTQSVGGSYGEDSRGNGIFHSMLKNIISQALDSLEIKIEGDDVPEEDIISRDFDIDNNEKVVYKEVGTENIYVSWLGDSENGYEGEIKNVARMATLVKGVTGEETIDELEEVLLAVNDCYVLRNTLGLIIESKTEEYKDDEDELMREFISRSDFEVFHKEQLTLTPYDLVDEVVVEKEPSSLVVNRLQEVELREVELKNVVAILNDADEISQAIEQDTETGFDQVNVILENKMNSGDASKPEESKLERILNKMHNSEIFNTKIYDEENNRVLTSFEYFFQYILKDEAFIVDKVPLLLVPTVDEIAAVSSDNSLLDDGWINGEGIIGEITNFNNSMYAAVNNPLVDIKLEGLDFIEAVQGSMAVKDSNGISIKVDGELIRDNTKTPIQDILTSLHGSRLLKKSNGHILDNHIVNYLLESIGYGADKTDLPHNVERNIYQDVVLEMSEKEIKDRLIDVDIEESDINSDVNITLWENEGHNVEDLIFAIDKDFNDFDIDKFDSTFIDELTNPLKKSVGLNYLNTDDDEYKANVRSVYHLVVIKIVNSSLEAFDSTLGLYTDNVNDNLISSYSNEINVSKDLIDAYKVMDKQNKFSSGSISFSTDPENPDKASKENKEFMDLVVKVLEPLYRSNVYHNVNSITKDGVRISKTEDNQLSNLTLFEQVVYIMLNSSEDLTNELYYKDGGISYPEDENVLNGKDVMNLRIREVTSMDLDHSSGLKWITLGSDNKVVYDCEIGKVHDMAGEDLNSTLNPDDLNLTKIVKDITVLDSKDKLLNIINASYILHDIVPNVIARYVSTHEAEDSSSSETIAVDDLIFLNGLDSLNQPIYKNTRGYAGEQIDSYIIEHTYNDFFTRVEHWNNDLYYVAQLTLLFDEIEDNSKIGELSTGEDVALANVFEPLLYNLSMTETYSNAVPQIVISVLNDKLHVDLGVLGELSMGTFIDGSNDPVKLSRLYELIDDKYGISEQVTTYTPDIWKKEGEGIDKFIKYIQTRNTIDAPTADEALGYHMYQNFNSKLGL